jgi:hypothetical protein
MKLKTILAATLAAIITPSAFAQSVTIEVTGATAFRNASMRAILQAYSTNGLQIVHDASGNTADKLYGCNKAIFRGNMPGVGSDVIVRTSWNGSAEGLNAIAGKNNPQFYTTDALTNSFVYNGTDFRGSQTNGPFVTNVRPKFAFSDVYQANTPVQTDLNDDPIAFNPGEVGVVTFAMVANDGASTNFNNVTVQQANALWKAGILPLSQFTGVASDRTNRVLAVGRNDGSGTRASYLSEFKVGVATPVQQYIVTTSGLQTNNDRITAMTLVPANGTGDGALATVGGADNASSLWGQANLPGNGGYASSSGIRDHLQLKTPSVQVYDGVDGSEPLFTAPVTFVSWLTTADVRTVLAGTGAGTGGGGRLLGFNGVSVTPIATSGSHLSSGFSTADYEKITTGQYSAWNYQQFYSWGTESTAEENFRSVISSNIITALGVTANGLPMSAMTSVSRANDGVEIYGSL